MVPQDSSLAWFPHSPLGLLRSYLALGSIFEIGFIGTWSGKSVAPFQHGVLSDVSLVHLPIRFGHRSNSLFVQIYPERNSTLGSC